MLDVPYYRQHRDYTCGPVCLRMVLAYYGHEADEVSLTTLCRTTVLGTLAEAIVDAARQLGFEGEYTFDQGFSTIARALAAGRPVIVTVDAGILYQERGIAGYKHMVVIIDANEETITYHDSQVGGWLTSPVSFFLEAWRAKEREVIWIWPLI